MSVSGKRRAKSRRTGGAERSGDGDRNPERSRVPGSAVCKPLVQSEERYRSLVEKVGEGIGIVDSNERFVFANAAAERTFGVAPGSLIGRSVSEFVDGETFALLRTQTALRRKGRSSAYEIEIVRPDGNTCQLSITATPQFDSRGEFIGTLGIFRDITESNELKDALLHSAQQWRATFDALGDSICLLDSEEKILRCNVAMTRFVGMTFARVLGRTCEELLPGITESGLGMLVESVRDSHARQAAPLRIGDRWYEVVCDPLLREEQGLAGATLVFKDVTERRRAEEALKVSEERYRTLHTNVLAGVYRTTPDGKIVSVNPALARMLGYESPAQLTGISTLDTYVIRAHREEYLNRLETDGMITGFEVPLRRRDGSNVWVSLSAKAVTDESGTILHYDGIMQDITARKRAEEELRRRTSQLEALREVGIEITAELEQEALLRSIVSRAVQLLEGISGSFYDYRSDQDVLMRRVHVGPGADEAEQLVRRGEGLPGRVLQADDAVIVGNAEPRRQAAGPLGQSGATVGVPVRWREELLGVLTVAARSPRTFTDADAGLLGLLATQAAIAVRNARLVASLRELNEFKDAVMGIVAHDLRGPLTHMTGFLDLLASGLGELDEKQARWLAIVRGAVDRMEALIRGILSYRRLTLEGELKLVPCDLNRIAAAVAAESEPAAVQKSHRLTVEPSQEPLTVLADDLLLREAIGNLLSNAIKYTPAGGHITVSAIAGDGEAAVVVRDTGPGIAEEDQQRLFQPFTRLASAGGERGVGLGLSLVKTIVERHGGRVSIESAVGAGSTFGIWLPSSDVITAETQ
jgi:PAS domain S-box-containing protein